MSEPAPAAPLPPNLTDLPEFKAAVAEAAKLAAKEAVDMVLAEMTQDRKSDAATPLANVGGDFVQALALAIAEIGDQGTGRKRVAPEVLAQRQAARQEMTRLILEAREQGKVPVYTLKHKVYLDEMLVEPIWVGPDHVQRPTEIDWPGVPNEAMRPANDVAAAIFDAFSRSIGSIVKVAQEGAMRVTARGLVVHQGKSRPLVEPNQAPVEEPLHVGRGEPGSEGLRLRGRSTAGQVVETRVLGTVAAPARQTA